MLTEISCVKRNVLSSSYCTQKQPSRVIIVLETCQPASSDMPLYLLDRHAYYVFHLLGWRNLLWGTYGHQQHAVDRLRDWTRHETHLCDRSAALLCDMNVKLRSEYSQKDLAVWSHFVDILWRKYVAYFETASKTDYHVYPFKVKARLHDI
jgi:hypothetical protein